jgi:hypothetical protein
MSNNLITATSLGFTKLQERGSATLSYSPTLCLTHRRRAPARSWYLVWPFC